MAKIKELPYRNITFMDMMTNPAGKNSAFLGNRDVIKLDLQKRFDILLKRHKVFKTWIYFNKDKTKVMIHVKVPSEHEEYKKLFYDVVYEFNQPEKASKSITIPAYNVKIFSNSPAFTFNYAYVANLNELIPTYLQAKCDKDSLVNIPKEKNPPLILGFEKTLYFAGLYIQFMKFHFKGILGVNGTNFPSTKTLIGEIDSSKDKLAQYNKHKANESRAKKKAKAKTVADKARVDRNKVKSMKRVKANKVTHSVRKLKSIKRGSGTKSTIRRVR